MTSPLPIVSALVIAAMSAAADAHADAAVHEPVPPGTITPLPDKGGLPRREGTVTVTAGGDLLTGDGFEAGSAFLSLRLAETVGVGLAFLAGADGAAPVVRLDALGLAINHWAFLASADYVIGESWRFAGVVVTPLRGDNYLRLSINTDTDGHAAFGLGLEHDLW